MPDGRYGYISRTLAGRNFYKLIPGLLCRAGQVVAEAGAGASPWRGLRCAAVAALWITVAAISGDYLYCGLPYGAPTDRSTEGNEGRRGASHEFIFVNHNVHLY